MCLGVPAKIINVDGRFADADIDGVVLRIGIQLLDDVKPGDFVLIHSGYALEKLDQEAANETINLIRKLEKFNSDNPPPIS
jgi:hydrogenase expression/formation protein HypC